ncbi:MAG: hypothetical protein ACYC6N_18825 [Pirellulaceae bacterium]
MSGAFASFVVAFALGVITGLVIALAYVAYQLSRFCRRLERRDAA